MPTKIEPVYGHDEYTLDEELMPENRGFIGSSESLHFIEDVFQTGNIRVQETDGAPVDTNTQRYLAKIIPLLLTRMAFRGIPLQPEDPFVDKTDQERELVQGLIASGLTPPPPSHITDFLKPDRVFKPESQHQLNHHVDTNFARVMRPFGERIWLKLLQRALETNPDLPSEDRGDIHPLDSLKGFNGMVIGLPKYCETRTYKELRNWRDGTSNDDMLQFIEYEASNGLITAEDTEELYALLLGDHSLSHTFKKMELQRQALILGHLPLTWSLIERLKLSQETITMILAEKLARGDLDEPTQKTLIELIEVADNAYIADFVLNHPKYAENERIRTTIEEARAKVRSIVSIARAPVFDNPNAPPDENDPVIKAIKERAAQAAKDKIREADRQAKGWVDKNEFLR